MQMCARIVTSNRIKRDHVVAECRRHRQAEHEIWMEYAFNLPASASPLPMMWMRLTSHQVTNLNCLRGTLVPLSRRSFPVSPLMSIKIPSFSKTVPIAVQNCKSFRLMLRSHCIHCSSSFDDAAVKDFTNKLNYSSRVHPCVQETHLFWNKTTRKKYVREMTKEINWTEIREVSSQV